MAANFSLTGSLRLSPVWVEPLDASTVTDSTTTLVSFAFQNGTGAGQANAYWRDLRTIAGGGTDSISMTAGLPLNVFGSSGTVQMDNNKLRMLYVRNLSNTVTLSVVLVDIEKLPLPPGGVLLLSRPSNNQFAGANAGDFSILNESGTAANFEVLLVGVKA
jgi:hypothetical protein